MITTSLYGLFVVWILKNLELAVAKNYWVQERHFQQYVVFSSSLRPRSLERKNNENLEHELQLKRLQAEGQVSLMMGPSTVQGELIALSEELAHGKLVKNLTLFPSLQITLVHPDMTREFEHACQVLYR